jgi:bis(5'-nucleosyl)-tetraphosphatase (symmetrical)
MSTYAIGDVQGCFNELQTLLADIAFNPNHDTLWFVGDLVNRGPDSLATLRFIKGLGDSAVCVLGNHDLHLLAVANGSQTQSPGDTLDDILQAPERDELLHWLRHLPLLHHDARLQVTLVHAGVLPQWSLDEAKTYNQEICAILQSEAYRELLAQMYGNQPDSWSIELESMARYRFIINAFTRMRYVTTDGALELKCKNPLAQPPDGLVPWFDFPTRVMAQQKIVFGHWAALNGVSHNEMAINIDTGCVWGNTLTALRLD